MGKMILGVVLAAVAAFFWGFLYFGASTVPYQAWSVPADGEGAAKALLAHFPERGIYAIPAMGNDPAAVEAAMVAGPVARVYMLRPQGRPMMDGGIMLMGFLHELIMAVGLALVLVAVRKALPGYARQVRLVAFIGLISAFTSHIGSAIWWETPFSWSLVLAFHEFGMFVLMGLILAKFVGQSTADVSEATNTAPE